MEMEEKTGSRSEYPNVAGLGRNIRSENVIFVL